MAAATDTGSCRRWNVGPTERWSWARGLIVEIDEDVGDPGDRGRQRRSYVLTPEGKARTVEEAQRLRALVQWAQEAMVLEGGNP